MKRFLYITIFILIAYNSFSQNFVVTWEKCYGGTNDDITRSIIPYKDGYLVLGTTRSHDGDISFNPVSTAAWLLELDKYGEILFDTCYSGMGGIWANRIMKGDSDYFYLFGDGNTNDPSVSGYWIAKADTNFNIIWQDVVGGSYIENSRGGCIAYDEGIIVSGITSSHDGDIEEYYGNFDNWLVKMNPDGTKDWVKTFGNIGSEEGGDIIRTSVGGYLYASTGNNELPGNTYCEGHDNQNSEAWLIKLNTVGEKEWHRCYGGSHLERLHLALELEDGYVMIGYTTSPDGDINNFHGQAGVSDVWVLKTDLDGEIIWSKCYGGSKEDTGGTIIRNSDNTFTILASTKSNDGDISENNAPSYNSVTWFLKIDENGNLLYEKVFDQFPYYISASIVKVSEFKYVLAGFETDFGCNFTPGNQNNDIYIFEIQDMDEFIPSQPNGADELCVENNAESIYFTQLVVDTMETQWQLIPEEAGEIINLHDSVRINWNPNYYDTAWLQVRAVNEYGESSYSEAKQILLKDCTGLGEIQQKQLKTYPNPASNQITFELPQITKENFLYIKDIYSKTIAELPLFREQTQLVWDCTHISRGVYLYQTQINEKVYRGKIIVN